MSHYILAALAASFAGLAYFLNLLFKKRREMDNLPCPPMKNRLFGHLDIAGESQRVCPPGAHMHTWIHWMQRHYKQGDVFYIDWWPIGPRFLFMSNPEMTSQYITTTNSLPKSPLETDYLDVFLGKNNMVGIEGQQWKRLRGMFNPGFSAGHLMTMVPYIVDAGIVFCELLKEKAKTNELFELEENATRLTIDVIGKVVLDSNFDSQKEAHPIVEAFRERVLLMPTTAGPIDFSQFELIRRAKLWFNGRKLDRLIGEELDRKMAHRAAAGEKTPKSFKDRKRSAVDLALDAWAAEEAKGTSAKVGLDPKMDAEFRQNAIDCMKTFIFAGHDTTASTISYVFYMLHFHPNVHKKVMEELDKVFGQGADTKTIAQAIKTDSHIINQLDYLTAVLKETLRLFPAASTLRYIPEATDPSKNAFMIHPETGQKLPLAGWHVWPSVGMHGRNEKFFPRPVEFIPERFIQSATPFPDAQLFTPAGKDAWRPFEKGPRNCIGQELAMIEMKIILAMSLRDLDFVAEYNGVKCETWTPIEMHEEFADGRPGKERLTVEGHSVFQILKGSAKPRDGMPGRLSFRTS